MTFIDPFLAPVIRADQFVPNHGTVRWRRVACEDLCQEIYERPERTLGLRYVAWVAWRDAGGEVRSHSWWIVSGGPALFTDSYKDAEAFADADLIARGLDAAGEWQKVGG